MQQLAHPLVKPRRRTARYFVIAVAALALLFVISFSVGRYPVTMNELWRLLWSTLSGTPSGLPDTVETVVFKVRGPRVLASMVVGGALAVSGAVYQGLFRNPLVSPDILGVSSGAALGAVLGIYFSLGVVGIQALAFALGLGAVAAVYRDRNFSAPPRSDSHPGACRRGDRHVAQLGGGSHQVSRRSLQSTAGDHFLALGKPYRRHEGGSVGDSSGHRRRSRAAVSAALAHECHDDGRRRGPSAGCRCAAASVGGGRGGHSDDGRRRIGERYHRLDRSADSAFRPPARRPRFRASSAGGGAPRSGLFARRRYACPDNLDDRSSARRADRVYRHAVLHLGACCVS